MGGLLNMSQSLADSPQLGRVGECRARRRDPKSNDAKILKAVVKKS